MTYRDLPYYEGSRDKTPHEYKLHENKQEYNENPLPIIGMYLLSAVSCLIIGTKYYVSYQRNPVSQRSV